MGHQSEHSAATGGRRRTRVLLGLGVPALMLLGMRLYTALAVRRAKAAHPPQGRFVTFDGARLHYVSMGNGVPVIFVHGDGGSVYDFTMSVLQQASTRYRAIAFDRPGFGYSEPSPAGRSLAAQAKTLHSAIDALGIKAPILVGHSRGGNLVLAYAQLYPDDVKGVVDLAGRPYPVDGSPSLEFRALATPVLGRLIAYTVGCPLGRAGVVSGLNQAFAPEGTPPPAYLDAYTAMVLRPTQLLALAYDIVRSDEALSWLQAGYPSIDVPLVIVHGTSDRNVPIAQSRRLAWEVPNATLIEIPGAGHELMFRHPTR